MDNQTQRFICFEKQIKANSLAIEKNKKDISELQSQVAHLKKENASMKSECDEHARYKRRWNLRLTGLPEKDDENVREMVIGILTRIIPVSVEKLRDTWIPCTGSERERVPTPQTTFPELSSFSLECAWFGMKSGKNLRMLESAKSFTSASRKIFPRRTDSPVLNCGRWCRRPEGGGSVRTWRRAMRWLTQESGPRLTFLFAL